MSLLLRYMTPITNGFKFHKEASSHKTTKLTSHSPWTLPTIKSALPNSILASLSLEKTQTRSSLTRRLSSCNSQSTTYSSEPSQIPRHFLDTLKDSQNTSHCSLERGQFGIKTTVRRSIEEIPTQEEFKPMDSIQSIWRGRGQVTIISGTSGPPMP